MALTDLLDPVYLLVLVFSFIVLAVVHRMIYKLAARVSTNPPNNAPEPQQRDAHEVHRGQVQQNEDDGSDSDEEQGEQGRPNIAAPRPAKIYGKKKRLKMEREAALKEYRKMEVERHKEAFAAQRRELHALRKKEKAEEAAKLADEEAWEKYLEEKRKKEEEEYAAWKTTMSLEASGSGESERDRLEAKSKEVITFILQKRTVVIETLAAQFHTSTSLMVELLQRLLKEGQLEGIFDDHGKFIYVSREDRLKVAKIIQRRGRVSIGDLVREANSIISIDPVEINENEELAIPSSSSDA